MKGSPTTESKAVRSENCPSARSRGRWSRLLAYPGAESRNGELQPVANGHDGAGFEQPGSDGTELREAPPEAVGDGPAGHGPPGGLDFGQSGEILAFGAGGLGPSSRVERPGELGGGRCERGVSVVDLDGPGVL